MEAETSVQAAAAAKERRRACVTESDVSWELGDLGLTPHSATSSP